MRSDLSPHCLTPESNAGCCDNNGHVCSNSKGSATADWRFDCVKNPLGNSRVILSSGSCEATATGGCTKFVAGGSEQRSFLTAVVTGLYRLTLRLRGTDPVAGAPRSLLFRAGAQAQWSGSDERRVAAAHRDKGAMHASIYPCPPFAHACVPAVSFLPSFLRLGCLRRRNCRTAACWLGCLARPHSRKGMPGQEGRWPLMRCTWLALGGAAPDRCELD
jgi:hypothetical protein